METKGCFQFALSDSLGYLCYQVMCLWPLEISLLLQCGDRFQTSESDVYRRQNLTFKVHPRTVTGFFKLKKIYKKSEKNSG